MFIEKQRTTPTLKTLYNTPSLEFYSGQQKSLIDARTSIRLRVWCYADPQQTSTSTILLLSNFQKQAILLGSKHTTGPFLISSFGDKYGIRSIYYTCHTYQIGPPMQ